MVECTPIGVLNMSNHVSKRQVINIQILEAVLAYARQHPTQRLGQILRNLGVVAELRDEQGTPYAWKNDFNTEPEFILKRMMEQGDNNG